MARLRPLDENEYLIGYINTIKVEFVPLVRVDAKNENDAWNIFYFFANPKNLFENNLPLEEGDGVKKRLITREEYIDITNVELGPFIKKLVICDVTNMSKDPYSN